jgi:hypothetical protein
MSSKFKRKIEDFVCENCGFEVKGNGFTNHCPKCLYSKHVDIFPGDRAETCGGMMEPVDTEENGGEWCVIQKCSKCDKIHKNKISKEDDFDHLVKINKKQKLKHLF